MQMLRTHVLSCLKVMLVRDANMTYHHAEGHCTEPVCTSMVTASPTTGPSWVVARRLPTARIYMQHWLLSAVLLSEQHLGSFGLNAILKSIFTSPGRVDLFALAAATAACMTLQVWGQVACRRGDGKQTVQLVN